MPTYLHPGVYVEEIPSSVRPIEGVATSTAAFIGEARRGPASEATLIGKLDDYFEQYGEIVGEDDAMGLAIQAFYLNGGGAAYICRIAGDGSLAAAIDTGHPDKILGQNTANEVLVIKARSVGEWGNGIQVQIIKPDKDSQDFDLLVGHLEKDEFVEDETYTALSMVKDEENYALTQVNNNSRFIQLELGRHGKLDGGQYQIATMTGGKLPVDATYLSSAFTGPKSMTLNLNGLGVKNISIKPDFTGIANNRTARAEKVRDDFVAAVKLLGADATYQNFTCAYSDADRRFTFEAPVPTDNASAANIAIYGGDLAELLKLSMDDVAVLTSKDISAKDLSDNAVIPTGDQTLTLEIDNYGEKTITLNKATIGLTGDNAADGTKIAAAIQNAVRAIDVNITSYTGFSCKYDGTNLVLKSGSVNSLVSKLEAKASNLYVPLGLDVANTALSPGRQATQGTAKVVPKQSLGPVTGAPPQPQGLALTSGIDISPTPLNYSSFFDNTLRKVRDTNILVLPGQSWAEDGSGNAFVSAALAHCEKMKSRMLIVDPPKNLELDQAATVTGLALPTSTYTTLYYPWVKMANPLYNEDTNPTASRTLSVAPSAIAAGMWAKIDGKRGVWKAPAGVEAQLTGAAGLAFNTEDLEQDQLNPLGVNCIRKLPNYGAVFWGTRTLATKAAPEWRYVPVRRTAIFIEQSIFNGIQWAVFEPNDHPLWSSLRANIGAFMNGMFRAGAFQGATADDAYFVRCGLGDTMTQNDIDRGQVIAMVGFAPLKPAEFVIVRIQQKVGQQ